MKQRLLQIFDLLLATFGKRNWWPADSPFEVMVGAILTQNTSWKNVEKAIESLKNADCLSIERIHALGREELAPLIRSSGFYNIKATRLKAFVRVIHDEFGGSIDTLKDWDQWDLRRRFLAISGIGEETADSILLYALSKPVFVVDAYTRRFTENHGLLEGRHDYASVQRFFTDHLPRDAYLFNEYHALLVRLGQRFCRKTPACADCPLRGY